MVGGRKTHYSNWLDFMYLKLLNEYDRNNGICVHKHMGTFGCVRVWPYTISDRVVYFERVFIHFMIYSNFLCRRLKMWTTTSVGIHFLCKHKRPFKYLASAKLKWEMTSSWTHVSLRKRLDVLHFMHDLKVSKRQFICQYLIWVQWH